MIARGVAAWLVLIAVEITHGIVRAVWLGVPLVGDWRSRQIGVGTGTIINFAVAALLSAGSIHGATVTRCEWARCGSF